ncbi:hypothetical protein V5799_009571 [Amblyomma americanum]|uniref:Uncharacterized protein n=1 Tax=Amblyomma americanum TaxID=6943 RepID=A0AAQ4FBD5_AMBAM
MLATAVGVATGFTLKRCGCDVMSDVSQPAFKDVLGVALKVARKRNIANETRKALAQVDPETVHDIAKRFSQCQEEPLSMYNLLGEQLIQKISRSLRCSSLLKMFARRVP